MLIRLLFCAALLCVSLCAKAQILKGDMNDNNEISVGDVTKLVSVAVGKSEKEYIDIFNFANNDDIVGIWYRTKTESFTLMENGKTNFPNASTYKYFPALKTLFLYDSSSNYAGIYEVSELTTEKMTLRSLTGNHSTTYYANASDAPTLITSISLSQTSLSIYTGKTATLTATILPSDADETSVTWSSDDTDVATVSDGVLTGVTGGTATITCTAQDGSGVFSTCTVTVFEDKSGTIDEHEYVDLGLPSGTLWATCNLGAVSPEEYGNYFVWGDTEGYDGETGILNWSTYKWANGTTNTLTKYCTVSSYGTVDNKSELELEDDAAYSNWGSNWRMPSLDQIYELINNKYTKITWTTMNDVYGKLITSKVNGNSIFLPAAGYRNGNTIRYTGSQCIFWSRTLFSADSNYAINLRIKSEFVDFVFEYRSFGLSVRPVLNK